jgi:hypothetical protein
LFNPRRATSSLQPIQSEIGAERSCGFINYINSNLFQFRVALLLSENEAIYSDSSVVINTLEDGVPESPPIIIQVSALDQGRILVSWKAGPKNNGPVLGYKLQIYDLTRGIVHPIKVLRC